MMPFCVRSAALVIAELLRRLRFGGPRGDKAGPVARYPVRVVGSVRRGCAKAKDLDFLAVVPRCTVVPVLAASHRKRSLVLRLTTGAAGPRRWSGFAEVAGAVAGPRLVPVDIFFATAAELPFALFHFTGPAVYNVRVRAHALARGWLLNQYGLFERNVRAGRRARARVRGSSAIRTEPEISGFIGIPFKPPNERA